MAGAWNVERMLELGRVHAELEAKCDITGTLATMVEHPVYEFYPAGLRMEGADKVRRYYEHLLNVFVPNTSATLIDEWVSVRSVAQEYEIVVDPSGAAEAHRVIGILYLAEGTELLGGERVYASEKCARLMLGDALFEELEPVAP
jgi:hypothetical protein